MGEYEQRDGPDEDIYCICKRLQEGEMIECEDKTVSGRLIGSAGWSGTTFHVLGLIRSPKDIGFALNVPKSRKTKIINFFEIFYYQ